MPENTSLELLHEILDSLETRDIRYALLHPGENGEVDTSSDVDIVLAESPKTSLGPLLRSMAASGRLRLLQEMQYDVPGGFYYVLQRAGAGPGD